MLRHAVQCVHRIEAFQESEQRASILLPELHFCSDYLIISWVSKQEAHRDNLACPVLPNISMVLFTYFIVFFLGRFFPRGLIHCLSVTLQSPLLTHHKLSCEEGQCVRLMKSGACRAGACCYWFAAHSTARRRERPAMWVSCYSELELHEARSIGLKNLQIPEAN